MREDGIVPWSEGWGFANAGRPFCTNEQKTILGIACERVTFAGRDGADEGDAWISRPLGILIQDNEVKARWRKTWKVTKIELREPDEHLFQIPTDFQEVQDFK